MLLAPDLGKPLQVARIIEADDEVLRDHMVLEDLYEVVMHLRQQALSLFHIEL